MKILVLIFGFYFLVLPCIACAETDGRADGLQPSVSQTDNHSGDEHEKNDCGGFCTCTCCAHIVTVNFQPPQIIINKAVVKNKALCIYDNISFPSNYFGNIWQPPKID